MLDLMHSRDYLFRLCLKFLTPDASPLISCLGCFFLDMYALPSILLTQSSICLVTALVNTCV